MPEIYKVGVTLRTPADRLFEANQSDTWRPPTPYSQVMAKRVRDAPAKEHKIHTIMDEFGFRIHPRREFFNAPLTLIQQLFDLMDECNDAVSQIESEVDENDNESDENTNSDSKSDILAAINKQHCDVIRRCLDDFRSENPTIQTIMSSELYRYYTTWCEGKSEVICISMSHFGRLICSGTGIIRQHRKTGTMLLISGCISGNV